MLKEPSENQIMEFFFLILQSMGDYIFTLNFKHLIDLNINS